MADGGLKLELDEALGERLRRAAAAHGRSVDEYAAALIEDGLDEHWAEAYRRFAEYKQTGQYLEAADCLREFQDTVAGRFRIESK
ncbi:hypothetical protein [Phenylobacterium montanum]|uniref:Uncharacterized protein n=1 Tax=Phenylobacterium montanum TaxID=2823693 RepID=A0A975G2H0_9CAUL|nr:hypothetical protein [Caulobacter sp. S6]QUD89915.1 hypothetical protein KCG34_08645 [Caulobacter sp. S6]